MPTKIGQNATMRSGDDLILKIAVTDADAGGFKNLTGAAVIWRASRKIGSSALISKSVGSGITITDAVNGELEVELVPTDTEDLRGDFVHEAEVVDSLGKKATVTVGRLTIERDLIA